MNAPSIVPLDLDRYARIVILTGAGISVASGLPTYRGTGGLWDTIDVGSHATAAAMAADPERVWRFFSQIRRQIAAARPNAGHLAIAQAERRLHSDQSLTVLTQNVDGLHVLARHQVAGSPTALQSPRSEHQIAGSPSASTQVVELHGSLHRSSCTKCDYTRVEDLITSPEDCPRCLVCRAFMRPAVVLFDEPIPVDAEWGAKQALRDCDLFLAVGTSGTVSPASNFVRAAQYAGARTVFVNREPMTPHNRAFHEVVLGRAEEVLPILLAPRLET